MRALAWRDLVVADLWHRPLVALSLIFSVAIAMAAVLIAQVVIADFEHQASKRQETHQQETSKILTAFENDIRKITKNMGFNIEIFPKGQELSEVYAQGYASKTMPETYVNTLAATKIITVSHLLPRLYRKTSWPEQGDRTVLAIGIRGQVPIAFQKPKKPLQQPVPPGSVVLGFELAQGTGLAVGDKLRFKGLELTVTKTHPQRGTVDDISMWISLKEMQTLFKLDGQINSILALNCNCATIDRLGEIRKEIGKILPGTTIIEYQSQALARAETRNATKAQRIALAKKLDSEIAKERQEQQRLLSIVLPLVLRIRAAWIAVTAWQGARGRLGELALLRAMGASTIQLLRLLLLQAFISGCIGSLLGVVLTCVLNGYFAQTLAFTEAIAPIWILSLSAAGVAWVMIISWLPALWASRRDPAPILGEEA